MNAYTSVFSFVNRPYYFPLISRSRNVELAQLLTERKDYFSTLSIHNLFNGTLLDDILTKFIRECQTKPNIYSKINQSELVDCFSSALLLLIGCKASKLYVQLTSQDSLVVKSVNEKGNVFLEFFFSTENGCLNQTVANIFIGQELQLSESGPVDEIFAVVRDFYETDEAPVDASFINASYELSDSPFAEAEI